MVVVYDRNGFPYTKEILTTSDGKQYVTIYVVYTDNGPWDSYFDKEDAEREAATLYNDEDYPNAHVVESKYYLV